MAKTTDPLNRTQRGASPREAEAGARREVDSVDLAEEMTKDVWGWRWLEQFSRDVRLALRTMARAPGHTVVLVLTLGLGIGLNSAIFTIVHAALLERLPFASPDRLVVIWEQTARRPGRPNVVSPANFLRWRERARAFEQLSGFYDTRVTLSGVGEPEELVQQTVTPDFFVTLGIKSAEGRTFIPGGGAAGAEDTDRVAVISWELWRRRFAGDPGIVGRAIRLSGDLVTVVGVMPAESRFFLKAGSLVGKMPDLWRPLQFSEQARMPSGRYMTAIGRLKQGATLQQAQAEMDTIASGLTAEWPQFDTGWTVKLVPLGTELSGELRPALLVLSGAVGFVLLIACANVANLLLARGAARRREFAIRSALGARRSQVVRQLLTETLVLSATGAVVGLALAEWGVGILLALSPVEMSAGGPVRLGLPVLFFTAGASILTVLICGLAPALEASRVHERDALGGGARQGGTSPRSRALRQAFVVSEVALAVVLLVGAGLLIRSFANLRAVDPGFDAKRLLTLRVALPAAKYAESDQSTRFFQNAVARVASLPGVESAGAVSFLPFAGLGAATRFTVVGRPAPAPGQEPTADVRVCDNGYFRAMRIPLLQGRWFDERELHVKSDVAIVNQAFARQQFAGENPLGRQVIISMNDPNVPTTIVGVVGDVRHADLLTPVRPMAYWPHPQLPYTAMTLAVRTAGDPLALEPSVGREIRAIDPDQPVGDVRSMEQWLGKSLARARFSWAVLSIFAVCALLLTAIGLYGVTSYAVSQRTAEMGIRLALGAGRGDIVRMVVNDGLAMTGVGLAIGVVLAALLSRTLRTLLFDVGGADAAVLALTAATLGAVAVLASYLPARRAARTDPLPALRAE
jgi:putative ABC transport system permease protein